MKKMKKVKKRGRLMPLPSKKKGQDSKEFVADCMGSSTMKKNTQIRPKEWQSVFINQKAT